MTYGCAVVQKVSRRFPTAAVGVRAQVRSCRICGERSGTGAGFLPVLRFPLPILILPTAPHSSSSITRSWCSRPVIGRRTKWTQSHPTPRKLKPQLCLPICTVSTCYNNIQMSWWSFRVRFKPSFPVFFFLSYA
jgi:hypothetical protein